MGRLATSVLAPALGKIEGSLRAAQALRPVPRAAYSPIAGGTVVQVRRTHGGAGSHRVPAGAALLEAALGPRLGCKTFGR
jgi:hypothetical protein